MVSQLGTLLIVFGFWKYGKEYCSNEVFDSQLYIPNLIPVY